MGMPLSSDQYFSIYGRDVDQETSIRRARLCIQNGDVEAALGYLLPLLSKADAEVQYLLSCFSIKNESEIEFRSRRIYLLEESAKRNYPPAVFSLAVAYDSGDDLDVDKIKADNLFLKAANLGHAQAQWIVATKFIYNKDRDFFLSGIEFLFRSADQNFIGALRLLAQFYSSGEFGFPVDVRLAEYYNNLLKGKFNIGY